MNGVLSMAVFLLIWSLIAFALGLFLGRLLSPHKRVSEVCRRTNVQDCLHCEDFECGDNINPIGL
jgi:Na+/H+-dicarboxylate symporter